MTPTKMRTELAKPKSFLRRFSSHWSVMSGRIHMHGINLADALHKANVWFAMNAGHLLLAEKPEFVHGETSRVGCK
jgi:hypothetical protein